MFDSQFLNGLGDGRMDSVSFFEKTFFEKVMVRQNQYCLSSQTNAALI